MVHEGIIIAFTSARHLSITWASSIQSVPPHPTSWISILILSSHLRLGLPSGLFPSGFPTKTLYTLLLLSPIRATCPAHLILFDFITRIIFSEQYRSLTYIQGVPKNVYTLAAVRRLRQCLDADGGHLDSVWMPMVATSHTYIESKIQEHLSYQFCFGINTAVTIIE